MMHASVDKYSITVDARDTIRDALDNTGDRARGRRLENVMRDMRSTSYTSYIVPAWETIRRDDYNPAASRFPAADPYDSEIRSLVEAGYAETFNILRDESSSTYLDADRALIGVRVLRDFVVQQVHYMWSRNADYRLARYGHAYADGWSLQDRSMVVKSGVYVVGEVGDYTVSVVGATYLGERDPMGDEDLFYTFAEGEGFGASRASAWCSVGEGHRWEADSGSWQFTSDDTDGDAPPFDFDDVDDFAGDTFACPVDGCSGRVGIGIY